MPSPLFAISTQASSKLSNGSIQMCSWPLHQLVSLSDCFLPICHVTGFDEGEDSPRKQADRANKEAQRKLYRDVQAAVSSAPTGVTPAAAAAGAARSARTTRITEEEEDDVSPMSASPEVRLGVCVWGGYWDELLWGPRQRPTVGKETPPRLYLWDARYADRRNYSGLHCVSKFRQYRP
jgi:hypothetical protein